MDHPLHVIAVAQRKGGPGKTTLSKMLAEYLVLEEGRRVLALDFDSQCNLSSLFLEMERSPGGGVRPPLHPGYNQEEDGDAWSGRSSSADMFFGEPTYPYPAPTLPDPDGLGIIPGDSQRLVRVEEQEHTVLRERVIEQTRSFIQGIASSAQAGEIQPYDVVLIDTSPSASPLTRAALRAATHLLIPVELEEQCVEGTIEMVGLWRDENRRRTGHEKLEILAIQPNRTQMQRTLHKTILEALQMNRATAPYISPVLIPNRVEFAERDVPGSLPRSIYQLPPSNKARKVALEFGAFMFSRLYPDGTHPNISEETPNV